MPSPFPGMNPYMESPGLWPGVHARLIDAIGDFINANAPGRYFADVEERVFLCEPDDPGHRLIVPDVAVAEFPQQTANPQGSLATAEVLSPSVQLALTDDEMTERYLTIREDPFDSGSTVVTIIEVLSPANKLRGSGARRSYLEKRRQVLNSTTHFIEIDLLRSGDRTPMSGLIPDADYLVTVSRSEERPKIRVFPATLTDALPCFPIPLLPGDEDLKLNLQAILHSVHDRSGYARRLDYSKPVPDPEISEDRREWLHQFTRTV